MSLVWPDGDDSEGEMLVYKAKKCAIEHSISIYQAHDLRPRKRNTQVLLITLFAAKIQFQFSKFGAARWKLWLFDSFSKIFIFNICVC